MEAKIVDLQEWVSFGGGGFGESYYNKTDDSVILKLNKPGISASKAEDEFLRSKAVFEMGIPSAEPYDFVTDGERYGMTVQRIQGKQSLGKIIADHPERLDEMAGVTAEYAKALHATPCKTDCFDSIAVRSREMILANQVIPDDIKERLAGYIDELEPATTCLHGDLNPCNIITAQGKVYWIDLGDFGYGDPLLDFNILSHMSAYGPNPLLRNISIWTERCLRISISPWEDSTSAPSGIRRSTRRRCTALPRSWPERPSACGRSPTMSTCLIFRERNS